MSHSKPMTRSKSMAIRHRGRHWQKRNRRGRGNTQDRLFEFKHGSLLVRNDSNGLHTILIMNATQPYRSVPFRSVPFHRQS
jgi:hypothetical protein